MAAILITPAAASAKGTPIMVYAPMSDQAVSENDVLNYVAIVYQNGYINETFYITQASRADRMNWLRETATKGFNPESDAFLYSCLLPNSATIKTVKTWFGHPITKDNYNYFIQGWFSDGTDAEIHFDIPTDARLFSPPVIPW